LGGLQEPGEAGPDPDLRPRSQRIVIGDASETALLKFSELTLGNAMGYRDPSPKSARSPSTPPTSSRCAADKAGPAPPLEATPTFRAGLRA
jgi:hypothetical protein